MWAGTRTGNRGNCPKGTPKVDPAPGCGGPVDEIPHGAAKTQPFPTFRVALMKAPMGQKATVIRG